jgi:glycerophosphoryl diester phosphodiesterase
MNLAEILQQYYYQTDFVNYVAQFGFPVDYVGPEYHAFFRDKDLVPNAHARGFKVAPWPVGNDSRDDLRQLFRLDPELVVTNKPEVAVSILTGLGQWDESSKEG